MNRRRVTALDAIWLLLGLMIVAALVAPRPKTGDSLGLRRFRAEVSERYRVTQRFTMNAPGLNGIELRAAAIGPVSGSFRLTLRDREAAIERTADVMASDLVRDTRYQFGFAPIEQSSGREYQLEIAPTPSSPGRGVALWATKGDRTPERALRINDVPRWGSLAFETHTPSVSVIRTLLSGRDPERPPQWLALVGLLGAWIALRIVLRDLMTTQHFLPGLPGDAAGLDAVAAVTAATSSRDDRAAPPAAAR